MNGIPDYLSIQAMKMLAIPSNFRLGTQIAKIGHVEFLQMNPMKVSAKVSGVNGSSNRTVEFIATDSGLQYRCTYSKKPGWFCKHCVAVGLITMEKMTGETA